MLDVRVDTEGFFEVDKFIKKYLPDALDKATYRSLNDVSKTIRSQTTKQISRDSGIRPAKLIRQRISLFKANRRRKATGIYFKYYSIPATAWGSVSWNRNMKGAKAGRKTFPGAFGAAPTAGKNTGKMRVYDRVSRTGNPQKDLRQRSFKLRPYRAELARIGGRVVRAKLQNVFQGQLKDQLRRKGFTI